MTDETNIPQRVVPSGAAPAAPARDPKTGRLVSPAKAAAPVEEAPKPVRSARPSLGSRLAKLHAPARPGYERRWINDDPGRVEWAAQCGWNYVQESKGQNWHRVVDKKTGLKAYLMEIPEELYREDQEAKQQSLDGFDQLMLRGEHNQQPGDKRYVPQSTPMKLSVTRGPGSG